MRTHLGFTGERGSKRAARSTTWCSRTWPCARGGTRRPSLDVLCASGYVRALAGLSVARRRVEAETQRAQQYLDRVAARPSVAVLDGTPAQGARTLQSITGRVSVGLPIWALQRSSPDSWEADALPAELLPRLGAAPLALPRFNRLPARNASRQRHARRQCDDRPGPPGGRCARRTGDVAAGPRSQQDALAGKTRSWSRFGGWSVAPPSWHAFVSTAPRHQGPAAVQLAPPDMLSQTPSPWVSVVAELRNAGCAGE